MAIELFRPMARDFQMNWLSLRNNRLKFKASGGLPITLEEFMEYTSLKLIYKKLEDVNM
jgi:hypothetical protein